MNQKYKIISNSLLILTLLWLAYIVYENIISIDLNLIQLNPLQLFGSIFFIIPFILINGFNYHLFNSKLDIESDFITNQIVYLSSYLNLYLPGKVGLLMSRIINHNKKEKKIEITTVFLLEILLGLIASFIVSVGILFEFFSAFTIILVSIVLLVSINPISIKFGIKLLSKTLKEDYSVAILDKLSLTLITILFLNLIKWGFFGFGLFLGLSSIIDHSLTFTYFTGAYSASSILGMLAIFSPSGIGVTEISLTYLLKPFMIENLAIVGAIVLRLWKLFAELLFIPVIYFAFSLIRLRTTS